MQDNNIIQEAIDTLKRLYKENTKLKAENERMKEELATYGATGVCEVCSDKANKMADKYLGCLQEVKAIAEKEYNKKLVEKDCFDCDASFSLIVDLITKAESVG